MSISKISIIDIGHGLCTSCLTSAKVQNFILETAIFGYKSIIFIHITNFELSSTDQRRIWGNEPDDCYGKNVR